MRSNARLQRMPETSCRKQTKKSKKKGKRGTHRGSRSLWTAISNLPQWAQDLRNRFKSDNIRKTVENIEHLKTLTLAVQNDLRNKQDLEQQGNEVDDIVRRGIDPGPSFSSSSPSSQEAHRAADKC